MRISTNEAFRNGIEAIQREQSKLAETQLQLSSGKRILTPSDDPRGAVRALDLRQGIAAVEQYGRNGTLAQSRLQREESVLARMGDALQRVRELTVQAANATQTDSSRGAIALELRQVLDNMIDAANTRDANGEFIFAGYRSTSQPFVTNAAGDVEYLGDEGQRRVAIAPGQTIAISDGGSNFMTVPRGNGVFVVTPDSANTGSGWVTTSEVVDPAAITNASFTILMTSDTTYDVLDSSNAVVSSGTYAADQAIDIGGRRIVLPLSGDSFAVDPAGTDSIFAMIDDLATALETPRSTEANRAQLNQSTGFALQNLDQTLERVFSMRSDVGARLKRIETEGIAGEENKVQLKETLSTLEDLDFAEAVSRLAVQQASLQAAQAAYAQMARLSLFDFIR